MKEDSGAPANTAFLIASAEGIALISLSRYPEPFREIKTGSILLFNLLSAFKYSTASILLGEDKICFAPGIKTFSASARAEG